jgi:hypothetical protein
MIHGEIKNAYHQKKIRTSSSKNTKQKINKKKTYVKKIQTNEIKKDIRQIIKDKLSKMGLIEMSICPFANKLVFIEIEKRIKLIQKLLKKCRNMYTFPPVMYQVNKALDIVNSLLKNPQETRR